MDLVTLYMIATVNGKTDYYPSRDLFLDFDTVVEGGSEPRCPPLRGAYF